MAQRLAGRRVAFLATDGVEEIEYVQPREAVEEEGAQASLISIKTGEIQAVDGMDKSRRFPVDSTAADTNPGDFDALVLPGGVANPDFLRVDQQAVLFARAFFEAGKPVGAICHGPWTLIDAGVVAGRTLTSWPSLRVDLTNAGASWVDEEVHTDEGLVTSRGPKDLSAFCAKIVEEFAEGPHPGQVAGGEPPEGSP